MKRAHYEVSWLLDECRDTEHFSDTDRQQKKRNLKSKFLKSYQVYFDSEVYYMF